MIIGHIYTQRSLIRLFVLSIFLTICGNDQQLLERLTTALDLAPTEIKELHSLKTEHQKTSPYIRKVKKRSEKYPLYQIYPMLEQRIPRIYLCQLPTPVAKLKKASKELGIDLYIKRDDVSNPTYGGNKNRALEFFVADAQRVGTNAIMTIGSAGSTLAVAAAHAAQQEGMLCYTELLPHPNSHEVQQLLLLMHQYGALMHFYPSEAERKKGIVHTFLNHKRTYGVYPYFIPAGASAPLGIIGYVNAMFELKKQIQQGHLPEPDYIYVACGTKGTSAGLLLGAKAVGLKSIIVPVCIKPTDKASYAQSICQLSRETNALLSKTDPTFKDYDITVADLPHIHYCTNDYGVFTPDGMAAKKFLLQKEGIILDGTYTAKAFSKLIQDAKNGLLKGKIVLFWNTYCATAIITDHDYHKLPFAAQRYFTEPVQPLDQ